MCFPTDDQVTCTTNPLHSMTFTSLAYPPHFLLSLSSPSFLPPSLLPPSPPSPPFLPLTLSSSPLLPPSFLPLSSPLPLPPGYPLSALDSDVQDTLLSAVAACPPLAQEGMFRHSVDCLLGEVRAELPTYATRVMLQALAECNPTVCSEATERVRQPSYLSLIIMCMRCVPLCTFCLE